MTANIQSKHVARATRIRNASRLAALLTIGLVACGDASEEDPPATGNNNVESGNATFGTGASGLFIGQSFFVPVAQAFDVAIRRGDFPGHSIDLVFAGGANGSPQALWENEVRRDEVEQKLATGSVELFGMTIGAVNEDNPADYYGRWIDLALRYNPSTAIFIGFPYLQGGPNKDATEYDLEITQLGNNMFSLVQALRGFYPDTQIYFINYGKVLSQMKVEFSSGELEDIEALAAPFGGPSTQDDPTKYLFADGGVGHAGPMAEEVCALVWASLLYGTDFRPLIDPAYSREDVERIVGDVVIFNQRYLP